MRKLLRLCPDLQAGVFPAAECCWNRLLVGEVGKYPNAKKVTYPILCNQCEHATCVDVCPAGATTKNPDGIVTIDSNRCTGCQYCVTACPFHVRTYYEGDVREYFPGQGMTELEKIGEELHPLSARNRFQVQFLQGTHRRRAEEGTEARHRPRGDSSLREHLHVQGQELWRPGRSREQCFEVDPGEEWECAASRVWLQVLGVLRGLIGRLLGEVR